MVTTFSLRECVQAGASRAEGDELTEGAMEMALAGSFPSPPLSKTSIPTIPY